VEKALDSILGVGVGRRAGGGQGRKKGE